MHPDHTSVRNGKKQNRGTVANARFGEDVPMASSELHLRDPTAMVAAAPPMRTPAPTPVPNRQMPAMPGSGSGRFERGVPPRPNVASRPDPTQEKWKDYYIDWREVMAAADEEGPRKRLAIMLWPDDTCTRFCKEIECTPTAPVLDADGKPKMTGSRTWMCYGAPKSCRFCSVWAQNPRNRVDTSAWPPAFCKGAHSPRECSRAALALLQAGDAGASFLRPAARARNGK